MTSSYPHHRTRNCRIGNRCVGHDVPRADRRRRVLARVRRTGGAPAVPRGRWRRGAHARARAARATDNDPMPPGHQSVALLCGAAGGIYIHCDERVGLLAAHSLDVSRRGTPGDNAVDEAFNGSLRRECLSQHHFLSVEDAQECLACGGRGLDWLNNGNTDHYLQRHVEPNAF